MNQPTRILATAFAAVFTGFLSRILMALLLPEAIGLSWLATAAAFVLAFLVGRYVWRSTAAPERGLVACVITGATVMGGVGFVLGFFGPMILAPGANQGPLLGIFITGPLGFVLGAFGGAAYWVRVRPGGATEPR